MKDNENLLSCTLNVLNSKESKPESHDACVNFFKTESCIKEAIDTSTDQLPLEWFDNDDFSLKTLEELNKRRQNYEKRVKYELILDSVPDCQLLPEKVIDRIKEVVRPYEHQKEEVSKQVVELHLHFKRVQAKLQLNSALEEYIQPEDAFLNEHKLPNRELVQLNYEYKDIRHYFGWNSIYCQPEVFNVVQYVSHSCSVVSHLCLFFNERGPEVTIDTFDMQQQSEIVKISEYLQNEWPEKVSQYILQKLRQIHIGWFNLRINNWDIYLLSKMFRLMMLIRVKMQDAIQGLIISSIHEYCDWLCTPCVSTLDVPDDYQWGEDVITSPFHSDFPVFHLVLHLDETNGVHFSSRIGSFEEVVLRNFDTALLNTHFIKFIDPMVLKNLIYEPNLYLSSIGLMDERITNPRNHIQRCYQQAIIPLKAYADRYIEYAAFLAMDNSAYVEEVKENKTMQEIKDEILMNIFMRQQLEEKLPKNIIIGPFYILVHPLKRKLIIKRTDVIQRLLVMLNEKIRDKTMEIVVQYRDKYNRLFEPPPSVEFVFDTQKWMDTLSELVRSTEEQMRLVLFDYDILNFFQYPLSNEDFDLKWTALRWPTRILPQINVTREIQVIDIEKFQKEQISEIAMFDKTLESLTVQVQEYQYKHDPTKAMANAKQSKTLSDQLLTTQKLGVTLNNRQCLFGLPELELENIDQLVTSFRPYETLWYTAANFERNRDEWMHEPLSTVDLHEIFEGIENSKNIFLELVDVFEESPRIQEALSTFLEEIRSFETVVKVMQDLTHHCWKSKHFQVLFDQTEMNLSVLKELTMQTLVEEDILTYRDVIKTILKEAIEEHQQEEKVKLAEAEQRRKEEEILEARRQRRLARTDI